MYEYPEPSKIKADELQDLPNLKDVFEHIAGFVPTTEENPYSDGRFHDPVSEEDIAYRKQLKENTLRINAKTFEKIPTRFRTDRLIATRNLILHTGNLPSLWLHFFADKAEYRALGLAVLMSVFDINQSRLEIHLTHPLSDFKILILQPQFEHSDEYVKKPIHFDYLPSESYAHYLSHDIYLPFLAAFASKHGDYSFSSDVNDFDTLVGFGSDPACIKIGQNLLHFAGPSYDSSELDFKHEHARADGSTDFRFNLPGQPNWPDYFEL